MFKNLYPSLWCPNCKGPVTKAGVSSGGLAVASGIARFQCRDRVICGWMGPRPDGNMSRVVNMGIDKKQSQKLQQLVRDGKKHRFVITCAQNATPVHAKFFKALLVYCKFNNAQLIVIPIRYKNPTSRWSTKAIGHDWWAKELQPYLMAERVKINSSLLLLADIKTQPTHTRPLEGFETISHSMSAIIGHPKLELTTIPTPQNKLPKVLTTTGAITQKNYIPSKAGKKGEHHHSFAACLVEVEGKTFHMRQLNAVDSDGSFMDLMYEYTDTGAKLVKGAVQALVMGDTHVEFVDPKVEKATFIGKNSIVQSLKPRYLVWHDVHDFHSQNHHDRDNVFVRLVKHKTGTSNVEKGLDETFDFIDKHTKKMPWVSNVFVPSNHPTDHFARWVRETDPRDDVENCEFWARTFTMMASGSKMGLGGAAVPDPFALWGRLKLKTKKQARFLEYDESFIVCGIELQFHGHKGPDGARGGRRGFGKVGIKTVLGHRHSPGIQDGVYQVGTNSRLRLSYNGGPSSWLHTDCLVYANGKRTLVSVIDGNWKL